MPFIYLDITNHCNSYCRTCGFRNASGDTESRELDLASWINVIEQARELGSSVISFGGGEPFLRQDFPDMLEAAAGAGFSIHLNTNGTMLNPDRIRILDRVKVSLVTVSLDTDEPELYKALRGIDAFEDVTGGIRRLKEMSPDIHVVVECTITRSNVGKLGHLVEFVRNLGADQIKFTPVITNLQHQDLDVNAIEDIILQAKDIASVTKAVRGLVKLTRRDSFVGNSVSYLEGILLFVNGQRPQHNCFAGTLYGNVDPFGAVFPCYDIRGNFNVTRRSLSEIWNDPAFNSLRQQVRNCNRVCWNVGNAEPSLLLNKGHLVAKVRQSFKEMKHYRVRNTV